MRKPLILSEQEKEDLKDLISKPGFKVIEKLAENLEYGVFIQFKDVDYKNPKNLEILAKNTYFLKGVDAVMQTFKTQTNQLSVRKQDEKEEEES